MKKILIVDDEPQYVEMLTMRLEANRYEVVGANNGEEALKKAESDRPNLVLLDVMMPGMDGFEVLRRLRMNEVTKKIPVVMLTAKGESKSIFKGKELGADDYLIKPCEPQDLLQVCKRYA